MFDGLLGRGFAPKGKPLIKLTKNKIDVLRRKRTATIKFLKRDLADLVSNGLDVNAYSRAGGLLDELRHLWKLDFVDKTCDFVYKQLSTMQKMEECPEDCREAVSSLMFAASGFSELPELRELRQMFHEKYADSLGLFVNQELVESMSSKPFSLEKKVKLMEDVALEFSIRWDSKAFEKRILSSSSLKEIPKSTHDKYKPVDGSMSLHGSLSLPPERKKADASERRDPLFQPDNYQNGLREHQHRLTAKEKSDNVRHASRSESKDNKAERKEIYMQPKREPSRERHQPFFTEGDTIVMKVKRENQHGLITSKEKSDDGRHASRSERPEPIFNEGDTIVMKIKRENLVQGNVHRNGEADAPKKTEVTENPKPSSTKKADKLVLGFKQESFFQGYKHENYEEHAPQKVEDNTPKPPKPSSKSKRTESIDSGRRHRNDQESRENAALVGESTGKNQAGGNVKVGEYEYDRANAARKAEEREAERMKSSFYKSLPPPYVKPNGKAKNEKAEASVDPKARFDGEDGNYPETDKKKVACVERGKEADPHQVNDVDNQSQKRRSSRRKHILQSGGGDDDDTRGRRRESSRKGLQVLIDEDEKDSEEKMMDKLLMHYSKKPSSYEKNNVHHKNAEGGEEMMVHQPARSRSLPNDQFSGPSEPVKTFARASTFQPERSSEAKHVHPKLPNYDDLAARFAELKGRYFSSSSVSSRPLHVCVVGSGPAGFYTAEKLLKAHEGARVDIIDRLPTPFGLVRSGVAPDHPETKIVTNQFSRVAQHERCSFYGNVKLGSDFSLSELRDLYHVVVLAYGAESDKDLGIAGENLSGIHSAREFVWWYNGHPDYSSMKPDLKRSDKAVILGQGNVALDVARILLRPTTELASTDIATHALTALEESTIRKVYLIGRRGPVQAALTAKELREVLGIKNLHIQIKETDLSLTPADELHFVFFRQPDRFLESDESKGHVSGVNLEKTILESVGSGKQIAVGKGEFEELNCSMVLKAIGYKSVPINGLPFDHKKGIVPNVRGRVVSDTTGGISETEPGLYVCGWLKRGPVGIIATNLYCAEETVGSISEDIEEKGVCKREKTGSKGLMQLLEQRKVKTVDFSGWEKIDAKEKQMGSERNKPREKLVTWEDLFAAAN
ncbi:unnamed protein product [Thlaspi arvense]|uniref:FAD/NAD(P)-binding domain-containing protein n=1 Tax=Thlaspi arvense TaxID=13288 RepID=A0AAU9T3T8_THLAR|nr:unnamed protein product [Thlaspi arvense]